MDDYLTELDIWLHIPDVMTGFAGMQVSPELEPVVTQALHERRMARERAAAVTERLVQTAEDWPD